MKANSIFFSLFLILFSTFSMLGFDFELKVQPLDIEGVPGVQSCAFGTDDSGRRLIIGGRVDGLHLRQPWASFDLEGHNEFLTVIDPEEKNVWQVSIDALSTDLQEQLRATNPEFFQRGDMLYIIGGYGYSAAIDNHTTFAGLTAVDVPKTIEAIISGEDYTPYIRSISDEYFQVTGGRLDMIEDHFYMVGGQKFIGRYNPQGPNSGQGFEQYYTNSIKIFEIIDDGENLDFNPIKIITDTNDLHRRDYNAASQIMPDGSEGITAFSGVFQIGADLPFLDCVNIHEDDYEVNGDFSQYYNHYHCAFMPLYSEKENEMHTIFFGGMSQYYDDAGVLTRDDNVPFVNTIARVTRTADGTMAEYKMKEEMPGLLGSGAEFMPNLDLPRYENGILKLDELESDTTMVGYILGGIYSTAANIFFTNDGSQSTASDVLYEVLLIKSGGSGVLNEQSVGTLKPVLYPNPAGEGILTIKYQISKPSPVTITVRDNNGKVLDAYSSNVSVPGEQVFRYSENSEYSTGIYFVTIETEYETATSKYILKK